MGIELSVLAALALVGFVAGFIDSIAGGGGLLALPALLIAGLDPMAALATNKLQGTFGTASATHTFWKKGLLQPQNHWGAIAMVFAGACFGVIMVSFAPQQFLSVIMPALLVGVAIYFAVAPRLSDTARAARLPLLMFSFGFAPLLGFYDGIFGPGTGSFFMIVLVSLFGVGLLEATARTKLFNFTSNVASLGMFMATGKIIWTIGLTMGVAQLLGAQLGARLAIKNGASLIRPLLVFMCLAMATKLLWENVSVLKVFFP
jgi:uncharacterized protein